VSSTSLHLVDVLLPFHFVGFSLEGEVMPLINCPECGKQVSDKAPTCPNCGFPLNSISSNEASNDAEGTQSDQPESVTEKQKDGSSNEAQDNNKLPDTQTKKPAQEGQKKKKQVVSGKMKLTAAVLGIVAVAEIAVGAMLASNIICIHEWSGNNCCQVNHCYKCGKVDPNGKIDPDAHSWNSATCTEPKTCVNCRKTVGEKNPDNHCFEDRSDGSKVCTRCGKIIPAPNSTDEAGDDSPSTATSQSSEDNNQTATEETAPSAFSFSPSSFNGKLKSNLDADVIDKSTDELISYVFVDDIKNPDMYAMLSFTTMDGQSNLTKSSRYDSSCNPSPILMIDTKKCDSAIVARGFIMACDSSLSKTDAQEVVTNLANSVEGNSGSTSKNGISYLLAGDGEKVMLRATVA
jgi:uncharacterized Zn finger protein (UPF0148 family)